MPRGGRLAAQDIERLLDLGQARALDAMAEEQLVAEIVAVGVELEQAGLEVEVAVG